MAQLRKAALTSHASAETVVLAPGGGGDGGAGPSTAAAPGATPPDTSNDAALAATIALSMQPAAVALAGEEVVQVVESDGDESDSSSDGGLGPATLLLPEGCLPGRRRPWPRCHPSVQLELLARAREAAALAKPRQVCCCLRVCARRLLRDAAD